MKVSSTKKVLSIGFAMMLVFLMVITLFSLNFIKNTSHQVEDIMAEQHEAYLIFKMRDSAYLRTLILHRMALLNDPFELDEENMAFNNKASAFMQARDELLDNGLNTAEQEIWDQAKGLIKNGYLAQKETVDLLLTNEKEKATDVLLNEVMPTQSKVMEELTKMLNVQLGGMKYASQQAATASEQMFWLVTILGGATLVIGGFVMLFVIRASHRNELDLINAREEALSANQSKSMFLANMSHEIRTPLTAIIGYAESLLDDKLKFGDKLDYINTIIRNGRHLLKIINDILDLSKIEANKLNVEILRVSPLEIVAEVESIMGQLAREKGLAFNLQYLFPIPSKIDSDPTRLKQILLNMVSNALKFTEKGSITINTVFDEENGKLTFTVIDTGIGMNDEAMQRIFKPFSQADASTTRKFGGTGLGLTISKQLANMLGGDLICNSREGKGTKFTLTVGVGQVIDEELMYSLPEGWSTTTENDKTEAVKVVGKVLLAEDSPDIQRLVTMYLKRTGAEVTAVANGQLAVEAALAGDFDLILMDMQMPVMDGVQATRWLRSTGYAGNIVALTANAMKEDRDKYMQAGVNDFLAKPIDLPQFYKTIATYLDKTNETEALVIEEQNSTEQNEEADDDSFEGLVRQFKRGLPSLMIDFANALEAKNAEALRQVAHKLKGMGGSFGFPEITDLSANIEALAKQQNLMEANSYVDQLNSLCNKIVNQ